MILLTILMVLLPGSCRDDLIHDGGINGDGESDLSVIMDFQPLCQVNNDTRTPGNQIRNIESLSVVIFDNNGRLFRIINQGDEAMQNLVIDQNGNKDNDGNATAPGGKPSDTPDDATWDKTPTPRATFNLSGIPFGRYRMYAVANMGTITETMATDEATLKGQLLEWKNNVAENNQMFGYFTMDPDHPQPGDFDAPLLTVNKRNLSIHSWIRRAASKVTVAFDGSRLKQDVWIYVNKVTIRDIPKHCYLGKDNSPKSDSELIPDGGTLYYNSKGAYTPVQGQAPSTDHTQWLTLTNDNRTPIGSDHSESAEALFFYENMQGNYPGNPTYDKRQKKDYLGILVDKGDKDYKDNVPYGTWVEVEAFYDSKNPANISSGKIIYRFMLGKDVTFNYNAQRNHHYKLTLSFNGWANQADWHIEYTEEDPGIQAPDVFYVPYLYNHQTQLPIKLNGNPVSLRTEIIENGWAPVNINTDQVPSTSEYPWNEAAYRRFNPTDYRYLGFLALAVPNETGQPAKTIGGQFDYSDQSSATDYIKGLYEQRYTAAGGYVWSQQERNYDLSPGLHQEGNNQYTVTKVDQGEAINLLVPLWTRNKTIIPNTGYSGNNPYEYYQRKAVIRITAEFMVNGVIKPLQKDVTVYQARRLVNPKGVWRSNTDTDEFEVHLMSLDSPSDPQFRPLESLGSWKAYIESGDKSFCYITEGTARQDTIEGLTGSEIRFRIKFNGRLADNVTKGCVIRINYHGGTCVHNIFVRQGYNIPVRVFGPAEWSSYSLFTCDDGYNNTSNYKVPAAITKNPLALGSFFKRRNYSCPILIDNNNTYGPLASITTPAAPNTPGTFRVGRKNTDGTWQTMTWADIPAYHTEDDNTIYKWATFTAQVNNETREYTVPSYRDFRNLDEGEYGVGVFYADGATSTAPDFPTAYGFQDGTNNTLRSPMGCRAVVVYNPSTGAQVLFPLGKNGMGRRTQFNLQRTPVTIWRGMLRYSDVSNVLDAAGDIWRPIAYDLPHSPGAIYWINLPIAGGHEAGGYSGGWDMNYFNFGFSPYTYNNRSDACPIKLIKAGTSAGGGK